MSDVWVVFQVHDSGPPPDWEFIGVFDSREKAVAACRDASYFIGRCAMNDAAPHERTNTWLKVGCWPLVTEVIQ